MRQSFRLPIHDRDQARWLTQKYVMVVALVGLAVAASLPWSTPRSAVALASECAALDERASAKLALLVTDQSELAQTMLGDALFRLRRARSHCRNGWVTLARQDYNALLDGRYSRRQ